MAGETDPGRPEPGRRELDRRELDMRELDRRELDRRELDRRELDRRELDRRELDRRELDRRELDRRELDIVVFGATGFVGRLVAEYLAEHAPEGVRIGLAGRSTEKLATIQQGLPLNAKEWPLIVADTNDYDSLAAMAKRTRVIATTVGPYIRYGMPLVEACVSEGTDYADLTGETLFVRKTLDQFDAKAKANQTRIVHSCGFDSIPSDLGVLLLFERVRGDGEGTLEDTTLIVTRMKGSFSGGTIDSMRATVEATQQDPKLRGVLGDPYSLSPNRANEPDLGAQPDNPRIHRDPDLGMWLGPFVMASYNTRVVRLSNAIADWAYGQKFRYSEAMSYGTGVTAPMRAATFSAGMAATVTGMGFGPTRAVLDRLLPAPGDGPDEQARCRGRFAMEIRTRTSAGARYRATIKAQGDPGYRATSVMLGESALCLAMDRNRLPNRYGVLTPATAMGHVLADRLRAADFVLDVDQQ